MKIAVGLLTPPEIFGDVSQPSKFFLPTAEILFLMSMNPTKGRSEAACDMSMQQHVMKMRILISKIYVSIDSVPKNQAIDTLNEIYFRNVKRYAADMNYSGGT
jgi:hypothetical protein